MPDDLAFTQAEQRSFAVPIIGALLLLAAGAGLYTFYNPNSVVRITATRTQVVPTSTAYKSESIVLGPVQTENVLFVIPTLTLDNHQRVPATYESATLTITDPTGAELTTHAVSEADILNAAHTFPQIQPVVSGTHLRPDEVVQPGATTTGTLLFGLQIPQSTWQTRTSAVVHVTLFHQAPVDVPLPK